MDAQTPGPHPLHAAVLSGLGLRNSFMHAIPYPTDFDVNITRPPPQPVFHISDSSIVFRAVCFFGVPRYRTRRSFHLVDGLIPSSVTRARPAPYPTPYLDFKRAHTAEGFCFFSPLGGCFFFWFVFFFFFFDYASGLVPSRPRFF